MNTPATQLSRDRLNEVVPRTYFVPEVEKPLLEFLRRARRMRDRERPLRIVFASNECNDEGRTVDSEFLEKLQFIMPAVVKLPALRDRRDDIEAIVHRVIRYDRDPPGKTRALHPPVSHAVVGRAHLARQLPRTSGRAVCAAVLDCANRELSSVHFGRLTKSSSAFARDPEEAAAARVLAAVTREADRSAEKIRR